MEVTAIQLPSAFSDLIGIVKYRDEVCAHFGLVLRRMNGNGSCFFHACVLLLSKQGIRITAEDLRRQVISFCRECQQGQHGDLGERIMMDIQSEVSEALVSSSRKHNGEVPANVTAYLDASLNTGVWVAGYHWIRAVAHLYQVCLIVVIHGYPCVYAFGNTSHAQLFLYKRDVETHYDALVHRVSSESHTVESALQLTDAPSEVEVVYTTDIRPAVPPAIHQTAAPSADAPSEVEAVHTTDIRPAVPPAIHQTAAPSADAPSEVEVVYTADIRPAVPPAIHQTAAPPHQRPVRACTLKQNQHRSNGGSEKTVVILSSDNSDSEGSGADEPISRPPDAVAASLLKSIAAAAAFEAACGGLPSAQISFAAGLEIKASSTEACKREVFRLFTLRGHKPVQRNSRNGYMYIKCDLCRASCGVSNNVAKRWQVTVCHPECNVPCGGTATAAAELMTCDICGDDQVLKQDAVRCNAMHTFCCDCFCNRVNSYLINPEEKAKFMVSHMHWYTPVLAFSLSDASFSGTTMQSSLLFM